MQIDARLQGIERGGPKVRKSHRARSHQNDAVSNSVGELNALIRVKQTPGRDCRSHWGSAVVQHKSAVAIEGRLIVANAEGVTGDGARRPVALDTNSDRILVLGDAERLQSQGGDKLAIQGDEQRQAPNDGIMLGCDRKRPVASRCSFDHRQIGNGAVEVLQRRGGVAADGAETGDDRWRYAVGVRGEAKSGHNPSASDSGGQNRVVVRRRSFVRRGPAKGLPPFRDEPRRRRAVGLRKHGVEGNRLRPEILQAHRQRGEL